MAPSNHLQHFLALTTAVTVYDASTPYSVVNPLAVARAQVAGRQVRCDEILRIPIMVIDANGRVVRVVQPR